MYHTSSLRWGGGANACYYLTKEFAAKGHRVQVVTANYNGLPEKESMNGVLIHRLNSARKSREHCSFSEMMSYLLKAMPYSEKLHRADSFDVCLVFFGIPSGPIGFYLKKKYRLPYIIRFGGGDVPGFQERFAWMYKLLEPAIRNIWMNADVLVANSIGLKKMALDFYGWKEFQIICNGVDTDYFKPKAGPGLSKEVQILFVSRLIERKGLQFVIPKLGRIQKKSNVPIHLTVVGDGPYRGVLEQIAGENEVGQFVTFAGQKSRKEILPYYQNADIFILPSKREGMPNVVLEAMACGLPVVMTPCQGAEELIDGNGFVSEINAFEDKVIRLVSDQHLRESMGAASRMRAKKIFSWKRAAESYMGLMKTVI